MAEFIHGNQSIHYELAGVHLGLRKSSHYLHISSTSFSHPSGIVEA